MYQSIIFMKKHLTLVKYTFKTPLYAHVAEGNPSCHALFRLLLGIMRFMLTSQNYRCHITVAATMGDKNGQYASITFIMACFGLHLA